MKRSPLVVLGLMLVLFCTGPAPAWTGSYFGTVVFQGKPVSEATVWLRSYGTAESDRDMLIETKSDAQGKFRLPGPKEGADNVAGLIARAGDGRIGWRSLGRWAEGDESDLKIELLPVGEARGRLTDSSGGAIARAKIQVELFNVGEGKGFQRADQYSLPSASTRFFEATTKDDGKFVLPGVPLGASVYAAVSAPGYGNPHIGWDQGQAGEFQLEKAGRLRIRFHGADDVKKLAGLSLSVFVRSQGAAPKSERFVNFHKDVKATGAETLEVDDVLPGQGELRFHSAPEVPYFVPSLPKIAIKPGEVTEVTVTAAPAARVRGRVLNQNTRQGVPGANVSIRSRDKEGEHQGYTSTKTDADGAFSAYIRPGQVVAYLNGMPADYAGLVGTRDADKSAVVTAGGEHTFPDILLEPALPIEGLVVDDQGKPVPGVIVYSASWDPTFERTNPRTDDKGRFVLQTLAAHDMTALRVRTPQAVTDGAIPVDRGEVKGPLRLVVSEKFACRLKGRVMDGAGKPIAGARVRVVWHYSGVGRSARWGTSRGLETLRTDADGRFQSTALWPGDRYNVAVSADGYSKSEATVLKGEAGKIHDVGTISLVRTNVKVAGVVVDSAGKPIAGVAVFNQGDAPRPLSTVTGADGHFQLAGLLDGPFYVFARKPGHRFTMKRMEASTAEARITLLRDDEPHPATEQPIRSPEHIAVERKLADYVIDKVLAMPEPATGGYQSHVFADLVRLDLARAKKWLAANKPNTGVNSPYARAVRGADIERVAGDDADEALTLAAPLQPRYAIPLLFKLADRFAKTDPARGLRFTEEAVLRARTLDPDDRADYLAEAADLVIRLGRQAAGKKLLDEAALLADKFGTNERAGYYRARIASHVAVHDLPRARALLQPVRGEGTNRYLSMLAARLAPTDTKTALALVDEMTADRSSYRALTQMRIACCVAERDPAEAVRILDAIADANYKTRYQAEGLSHVAVLVAPRDRKLARLLIDRSFALYLDDTGAFRSWSNYGGNSVFAAWTAGQAQVVGYPDMASVVARVLACRPTEQDGHSPAHKLETLVRMAKVLALVDPAAARQLLDGVTLRSNLLGTGYSGFESQDWLMARCLADPERAPALVDEAIAKLKRQKGERDFYGSGLMQLAEVLTAPPDQRVRAVMGLNSGLVVRDEE